MDNQPIDPQTADNGDEQSAPATPASTEKQEFKFPDSYILGQELDWDAPWIDASLWTELPFWLMTANTTVSVEVEGHVFELAVHENYFELHAGEVTDSKFSVAYQGPLKTLEGLSERVQEAIKNNPNVPFMWRKCKTVLKIKSRCNQSVWNSAITGGRPTIPREANVIKFYLASLCRAHIPVINKLIQGYRLATYDYFPHEVTSWDVPRWIVEHDGQSVSAQLVRYREWDYKPHGFEESFKDLAEKIQKGEKLPPPTLPYELIHHADLQAALSIAASPGELDLMDALNFMERGDYSGTVRRVTTALEVIVESVVGKVIEEKEGAASAAKFLEDTETNFRRRLSKYEQLSGRKLNPALQRELFTTRKLRHRIVHGGYRIGFNEIGTAQKAIDTGRGHSIGLKMTNHARKSGKRRLLFVHLADTLVGKGFPHESQPRELSFYHFLLIQRERLFDLPKGKSRFLTPLAKSASGFGMTA